MPEPAKMKTLEYVWPLAAEADGAPRESKMHGLTVTEQRPVAMLLLRGDVAAVHTQDGWQTLRYGPDAAIAVAAQAGARALDTGSCHTIDVRDARACIRLAGVNALDALASGCPLDLDALDQGACAASVLGPYHVILHKHHAECIDIYVTRSYAASLWDWLYESISEYRTA